MAIANLNAYRALHSHSGVENNTAADDFNFDELMQRWIKDWHIKLCIFAKQVCRYIGLLLWWSSVLLLPPLVFADTALADTNTVSETLNTSSVGTAIVTPSIGKTALILLLLVAAIVLLLWLIKRFSPMATQMSPHLKVIASLSVGPRERLMVVEVGNEQVLVGVTPGHIANLHTLNEKLPGSSMTKGAGFSQILQHSFQRQRD